jgi:Spo12 family
LSLVSAKLRPTLQSISLISLHARRIHEASTAADHLSNLQFVLRISLGHFVTHFSALLEQRTEQPQSNPDLDHHSRSPRQPPALRQASRKEQLIKDLKSATMSSPKATSTSTPITTRTHSSPSKSQSSSTTTSTHHNHQPLTELSPNTTSPIKTDSSTKFTLTDNDTMPTTALEQSATYISPSDAMLSPTTKKLSEIKGRRFASAKTSQVGSRALFQRAVLKGQENRERESS